MERIEICIYCGQRMSRTMDSVGVSHHITSVNEIDYDADALHMPVSDAEYERLR